MKWRAQTLCSLDEIKLAFWNKAGNKMYKKRLYIKIIYEILPDTRCFSDNMTLVTGLRCTVNVWKSCGPWPTVSGCLTITRTVPELVPYATSIQFPLRTVDDAVENKRPFKQLQQNLVKMKSEVQINFHLKIHVMEKSHQVWMFIKKHTVKSLNDGCYVLMTLTLAVCSLIAFIVWIYMT